jgi:hypothetical protein
VRVDRFMHEAVEPFVARPVGHGPQREEAAREDSVALLANVGPEC